MWRTCLTRIRLDLHSCTLKAQQLFVQVEYACTYIWCFTCVGVFVSVFMSAWCVYVYMVT